ncbi:coiled-coil domain-containing protein [Puniceicoccus vermicola]|uniref:Chromosome partition protein Smc n=1 Tax=Puniceicoccus vermicola TaxID=388746 RepID=A0A7X1E674_9BACT|nr:hypothetical protein [Puniceicoccus vermicola]MBC2602362.1 hypothetical protein [Puniceicoccus vermicola]
MNRSLLLIVCDFLLLSLLALANFEQTGDPVTSEKEVVAVEVSDEPAQDEAMMNLLASALEAEQSSQSDLQEQLAQAQAELSTLESSRDELSENLEEKEKMIAERERLLAEREELLAEARKEAQRVAAEKASAEKRAAAIQAERDQLEAERQAKAAETEKLAATVNELANRADTSAEELERRTAQLANLEAQLASRSRALEEAERQRAQVETERRRLANEVATAEREKQLLSSTLDSARQTINVERQEKEQLRQQTESLTQGVSRLAEASSEITEEVKNLRPKTANEIYQTVNANRVQLQFEGARSGLFGEKPFSETVDTVVTEIDGRYFLWVHLSQTPFADADRRKFLNSLDVYFQVGDSRFRIPQMGILQQNRSLLFLPLSQEIVSRIGVDSFANSEQPFRFEDLVVIDLPDSRYGETGFRINTGKPDHIEVDNRIFSALFGEFSPGAGDFAFTKAGAFLGIVTRGGEAWMAEPVKTGGKLNFGEKFTRAQLNALP